MNKLYSNLHSRQIFFTNNTGQRLRWCSAYYKTKVTYYCIGFLVREMNLYCWQLCTVIAHCAQGHWAMVGPAQWTAMYSGQPGTVGSMYGGQYA